MNLYSIIDRSERATVKLVYRLKHDNEKLARLKNHLTSSSLGFLHFIELVLFFVIFSIVFFLSTDEDLRVETF